jgi:hypothetical protein
MGIRFNSLAEMQEHCKKISAVAMARNLGKSFVDWSASGFQVCNEEQIQNRLNVCSSCEFMSENRCLKCGCFIKAKARLATSKCPIDKWQSLTPPPSV